MWLLASSLSNPDMMWQEFTAPSMIHLIRFCSRDLSFLVVSHVCSADDLMVSEWHTKEVFNKITNCMAKWQSFTYINQYQSLSILQGPYASSKFTQYRINIHKHAQMQWTTILPEQNPSILDETCPRIDTSWSVFQQQKTGSHLPQISRHQKKIRQDLGAGTGNIQASPSWKLKEKNWQTSSILQRNWSATFANNFWGFFDPCVFFSPHRFWTAFLVFFGCWMMWSFLKGGNDNLAHLASLVFAMLKKIPLGPFLSPLPWHGFWYTYPSWPVRIPPKKIEASSIFPLRCWQSEWFQHLTPGFRVVPLRPPPKKTTKRHFATAIAQG